MGVSLEYFITDFLQFSSTTVEIRFLGLGIRLDFQAFQGFF